MSMELLFECLSEEIPAKLQKFALNHINNYISNSFNKNYLQYDSIESFVSARRLVLVVKNIEATNNTNSIKIRGPQTNASPQAIAGFLKKNNRTSDDLIISEVNGKEYYFVQFSDNQQQNINKIIQNIIDDMLNSFPWPKTMHWEASKTRWIRPILNILCIFNGEILEINKANIKSHDITFGHRFLNNQPIKIKNFSDYANLMKQNHVLFDQKERLEFITNQINMLLNNTHLKCEDNPALLNEINGLIEYPFIILGKINHEFFNIPHEIIISVMHNHQRYLAVTSPNGQVSHFIAVTSVVNPKVISGHERVLNARLTDAQFMIEQDKKYRLSTYANKLDTILFHAQLGTMKEKVNRIIALAKYIAIWIPHASLIQVERAAYLSKADLTTTMVKEFPELQGFIGSYYATVDQEENEVIEAIAQHHYPTGHAKTLPTSPVAIAITIADKIDSLVGFITIGEKPSSSRDPFGLRRHAISLIKIIIENNLPIPLNLLIDKAISLYPKSLFKENIANIIKKKYPLYSRPQVKEEAINFVFDRFKVILKDEGIENNIINALLNKKEFPDFLTLKQQSIALQQYLQNDQGKTILNTYKRVKNIIIKSEQSNIINTHISYNKKLLIDTKEIALSDKIEIIFNDVSTSMKSNNLYQALDKIFTLSELINNYMDNTRINDTSTQDLRANRMALLINILNIFHLIADFSKIENLYT